MFITLYIAARWATKVDPQILRILLNATKFRTQYDPGKREPLEIEVVRHGAQSAEHMEGVRADGSPQCAHSRFRIP